MDSLPPSTLPDLWWQESAWASLKQDLGLVYRFICVCPAVHQIQAHHLIISISHVALYYTKEEMGLRMAYWFGFAAVAGAFGGLIAYGVQHAHAAIADWRLLFIIEGTPTIVLGVLCMLLLPNRPEETNFFNEEERKLALERINRGLKVDVGRTINKSIHSDYMVPFIQTHKFIQQNISGLLSKIGGRVF